MILSIFVIASEAKQPRKTNSLATLNLMVEFAMTEVEKTKNAVIKQQAAKPPEQVDSGDDKISF